MDLLLAIKELYTLLVEYQLLDKVPELDEIEKTADELYAGKKNPIKKYITLPLAGEKYQAIQEKMAKIEEIIANEKTNN